MICFSRPAILLTLPAYCQNVITTFAGADFIFDGDGKRATSAPLGAVVAVAVDRQGLILIADSANRMVMRFPLNGNLAVIAAVEDPRGIAVDPFGEHLCLGRRQPHRQENLHSRNDHDSRWEWRKWLFGRWT